MSSSRRLLHFLNQFAFQPLSIHRVVDARKRLAQTFDPDFPLLLRFYSFPEYRAMLGANWLNWHEHLEVIVPVSGAGRFRTGEQIVAFSPGDLLLVDNLKLHGVQDLDGEHRSLVIHFPPEFVYGAGSCQCDAAFLAPFWERSDTALPILRGTELLAQRVHESLIELVRTYFCLDSVEDKRAACKLHLLQMLYLLRRHFEFQGKVSPTYAHQRQRVQRLKRLFDFLHANYAQKVRLREAAALTGMSETRFKGFFKQTTGTTFARYVVQLRLARAAQLLRDTDLSMGEIAYETGFCDQSHLDNRFKEGFQINPKDYRLRHRREGAAKG